MRTQVRELESSASGEVKAAWGVLGDDYDRFTNLVDGADLSFDELRYWADNGKLPASVDKEQSAQFLRRVKALDDTFVEVTGTIVAHAYTECGIDLEAE